jgi:hypothetical protein
LHLDPPQIKNQAACAQKMPLRPNYSGLGFFIRQKNQASVDRVKFCDRMISVLMNCKPSFERF